MSTLSLSHEDLMRENLVGLLKALVIMAGICIVALAAFTNLLSRMGMAPVPTSQHQSLATVPYTTLTYPHLGTNATPLITLPTTVNGVSQNITYLVDTGAVITALPSHYAKTAALDLSKLKRIILSSLTTKTVYGYVSEAKIKVGNKEIILPVTIAAIDTPVLGRQGFLDQYSLIFNHQLQMLTISTNK